MSDINTKIPELFDYIGDISYVKKHIFSSNTNSKYNQFLINQGLSLSKDCALLVNEVNKPGLSDLMHFQFLFYTIRPRKRYESWPKTKKTDERAEKLAKKLKCSTTKALEYLKIMNAEDVDRLIQENIGGKC